MQIFIKGKNFRITTPLRRYAEEKIAHLQHYIRNIVDAHVTLRKERNQHVVDVTVNLPHFILKAEERSSSMQASIDLARDALEAQIRKYKTKHWGRRHRAGNGRIGGGAGIPRAAAWVALENSNVGAGLAPAGEGISVPPRIVRTKRFVIKPMDSDEAIRQMQLLGHDFFVFLSAESGEVNVLYRRKRGNLGLLEPLR